MFKVQFLINSKTAYQLHNRTFGSGVDKLTLSDNTGPMRDRVGMIFDIWLWYTCSQLWKSLRELCLFASWFEHGFGVENNKTTLFFWQLYAYFLPSKYRNLVFFCVISQPSAKFLCMRKHDFFM